MDGYLRGLQMVLRVSRIGSAELARATQLINKTNQFNLTTRRYTEAEVERMASDRQAIALALRLEDKFGDSGLISVVLARPDAAIEADELLIDSWLMSCRVLGRQVESAVLDVLADAAAAAGWRALVGEYRPTERNGMVAEHYPRLGFEQRSAPITQPRCQFLALRAGVTPIHKPPHPGASMNEKEILQALTQVFTTCSTMTTSSSRPKPRPTTSMAGTARPMSC